MCYLFTSCTYEHSYLFILLLYANVNKSLICNVNIKFDPILLYHTTPIIFLFRHLNILYSYKQQLNYIYRYSSLRYFTYVF